MLSATDCAIRFAAKRGTLRVESRVNSITKEVFAVISDEHGVIEVADDLESAEKRIHSVKKGA